MASPLEEQLGGVPVESVVQLDQTDLENLSFRVSPCRLWVRFVKVMVVCTDFWFALVCLLRGILPAWLCLGLT